MIYNFEFLKIYSFQSFFYKYFLNVNISLTPVWISMNFLPAVGNTQMSQICYIGPSFDFMIKNGKLYVIAFLTFIVHFIE